MNEIQDALAERDDIIQELTNSLKQSIAIRDQLNERNKALENETQKLKVRYDQRKWITDRDTFNEPRLSETTIELVGASDFEDDDLINRKSIQEIEPQLNVTQTKDKETVKSAHSTIENFKKSLSEAELTLFAGIQERFEQMLNDELIDIKEKLHLEQIEKAELDTETNRLRQLLANIKSGSTEVVELRIELDRIHKIEMENLRMYFERKCTDMEKQ